MSWGSSRKSRSRLRPQRLGDLIRVGGGPGRLGEGARIMNRLSQSLGGPVTLLGPEGTPLATAGRPLPLMPRTRTSAPR